MCPDVPAGAALVLMPTTQTGQIERKPLMMGDLRRSAPCLVLSARRGDPEVEAKTTQGEAVICGGGHIKQACRVAAHPNSPGPKCHHSDRLKRSHSVSQLYKGKVLILYIKGAAPRTHALILTFCIPCKHIHIIQSGS
ncbi:hypothetical protein CHARACLAT_012016 [Characodon lateralis]|uniref:Uncharacterized protein n=1 Tax=Characodon lateralis TaxID=208331 RepID=A0ABU7EIC2_9TELE|nr:hypothetical protein [Characodon lateralis]